MAAAVEVAPAATAVKVAASATPAARPANIANIANIAKQAKQAKPAKTKTPSPAAVPPAAATASKKAAKPTKSVAKPATQPAATPAPKPFAKTLRTKEKLVRDSFTMPRADFVLIQQLKDRSMGFQRATKKSELLRAGLQALAALSDAQLQTQLGRLATIKAGRPKKAD